jgi:hypothetical protein
MSLYVVVHPNPYFRRGAYLEDDRDGFVQEVVMAGSLPSGYRGIMVPLSEVRAYTIQVRSRGLDKFGEGALQ